MAPTLREDIVTLTPDLVHEAVRRFTAADGIFAVTERQVAGVPQRVFTHAAPTVLDILSSGRGHGGADFLVFGDQRWTFDAVLRRRRRTGRRAATRHGRQARRSGRHCDAQLSGLGPDLRRCGPRRRGRGADQQLGIGRGARIHPARLGPDRAGRRPAPHQTGRRCAAATPNGAAVQRCRRWRPTLGPRLALTPRRAAHPGRRGSRSRSRLRHCET